MPIYSDLNYGAQPYDMPRNNALALLGYTCERRWSSTYRYCHLIANPTSRDLIETQSPSHWNHHYPSHPSPSKVRMHVVLQSPSPSLVCFFTELPSYCGMV